jgi:hypothetical protein
MDGEIRTLCCRDIGGDHQQLSTVNTQHSAITFKHILQPVWLAPYHYRDKVYRIVVNARTGEVVGTRPYSFWKPVLLVLAIIAAIAAIAGIAALFGAFTHSHGRRDLPPRPPAAGVQIAAGLGIDQSVLADKRKTDKPAGRKWHGRRNDICLTSLSQERRRTADFADTRG